MKYRFILFLRAASVLICFHLAEAQQSKVPRIGYLAGTSLSAITDRTEAFRHGLRELGYVEGKNIVIEWQSGEGNRNRERTLAAELVRLKVDVIVTAGSSSTRSPRKQLRRFRLSCRSITTLWPRGSS
jgi:putative tryptophan/tyrosine transport system substrate-binding protein